MTFEIKISVKGTRENVNLPAEFGNFELPVKIFEYFAIKIFSSASNSLQKH